MAVEGYDVAVVLRMVDEATDAMSRIDKRLDKQLRRMDRGIRKQTGSWSASFRKFGRLAAAGIAAAGAAAGAAGAWMLKLGSDAEEVANVTHLAFGSLKSDAERWAAEYSQATGSSRDETIRLVSDLGLMVSGMGFAGEAALGMSQRMVELAGDMSSAKNIRLEEALDKIRAGLIGEAEPLRTMGVLLSAARVKEEAYASGIARRGAELTEAQKVEARMNIILTDSAAMHGDLLNTQDSAANLMRRMQNEVKDAGSAIGRSLQPALRLALKALSGMTGQLKAGADRVGKWLTAWQARGGLGKLSKAADMLWKALKVVGEWVGLLFKPFVNLIVFVGRLVVAFIKWASEFGPIQMGMTALVGVVKTALEWIGKLTGWLAKLIPDSLLPDLGSLTGGMEDVGENIESATEEAEQAGPAMRELDAATAGAGRSAAAAAPEFELAATSVEALAAKTELGIQAVSGLRGASLEPLPADVLQAHEHKMVTLSDAGTTGMAKLLRRYSRTKMPADLAPPARKIADLGRDVGGTLRGAIGQVISPQKMADLFTAAFTGGGGVLGALKGIGSQLLGALTQHFLDPLASKLSGILNGLISSFGRGLIDTAARAGAQAAAGAGAGAAGAAAGGGAAAAGGGAAAGGTAGGITAGAAAAAAGVAAFPVGAYLLASGKIINAEKRWGDVLARERERLGLGPGEALPDIDPGSRLVTDLPGLASGGAVTAGRRYLVGERGPELFIPATGGRVDPNSALPTAGEIGRAVAAALTAAGGVRVEIDGRAVAAAVIDRAPEVLAFRGYR